MKHKLQHFILLFTLLFGALALAASVKAKEVISYTNNASITRQDGKNFNNGDTLSYWEPLTINNQISFPDSQEIKKGDTLTLSLPDELKLETTDNFQVMHATGELAGEAQVDSITNTVIVTFTDIFERLPIDKTLSLGFDVRINHSKVTTKKPINVEYAGIVYTLIVDEGTVEPITSILTKTGYQDPNDARIIHWKILVNSQQTAIENLTIKDVIGSDQEIDNDSMLAVQVQYIEGDPVDTLQEAASRPYASDFTTDLSYSTDDTGRVTGFEYTIGGISNNAVFFSYDTHLTKSQSKGNEVTNSVAISGDNIEYVTQTGYSRIEKAYGSANSRRRRSIVTTTTTEATSTTTSAETTTTTTTATTVTSEETTTPATTVTTENTTVPVTTVTSEETTTPATTVTSEETTAPATTVTSEETTVPVTTVTSEENTTLTTTEETSSVSKQVATTTTTEQPSTTTEKSSRSKKDKKLPNTGETIGYELTLFGILILGTAGALIVKKRRK